MAASLVVAVLWGAQYVVMARHLAAQLKAQSPDQPQAGEATMGAEATHHGLTVDNMDSQMVEAAAVEAGTETNA
jgi:hypothetical protein